jgi:hypothetical protein
VVRICKYMCQTLPNFLSKRKLGFDCCEGKLMTRLKKNLISNPNSKIYTQWNLATRFCSIQSVSVSLLPIDHYNSLELHDALHRKRNIIFVALRRDAFAFFPLDARLKFEDCIRNSIHTWAYLEVCLSVLPR